MLSKNYKKIYVKIHVVLKLIEVDLYFTRLRTLRIYVTLNNIYIYSEIV